MSRNALPQGYDCCCQLGMALPQLPPVFIQPGDRTIAGKQLRLGLIELAHHLIGGPSLLRLEPGQMTIVSKSAQQLLRFVGTEQDFNQIDSRGDDRAPHD